MAAWSHCFESEKELSTRLSSRTSPALSSGRGLRKRFLWDRTGIFLGRFHPVKLDGIRPYRSWTSEQPQEPLAEEAGSSQSARPTAHDFFKNHVLISSVSVSGKDVLSFTENVVTLFKMVFNIMRNFSDSTLLASCSLFF